MTDDGIDGTRLTNNDANDFEPRWSPDGEKIALAALETASTIRKSVINADGTDKTRLTNNRAYNNAGRGYIPSYYYKNRMIPL